MQTKLLKRDLVGAPEMGYASPVPLTPFISLDDVSFSYRKRDGTRAAVLQNFSLGIEEGGIYCLLGPSGCGKTTVLNLVAGFTFPDAGSGNVIVEGGIVTAPGPDRGVVFQGNDSLFDWLTALDNVAFGPRMRGTPRVARYEEAHRLLELVGLRASDGTKRPPELSGGMKQRIQLARVLANNPKTLLLDEPFGALDAQTRLELQEELVAIWGRTRKTMLFITHDIAESILLADRIGVMGAVTGKIEQVFVPRMARPRTFANPEFGVLYEQIHAVLREEVLRGRDAR